MSKTCKKCGGAVKTEDAFCMHCGMPLEKEEKREPFVKEEIKKENLAEVLSMWDYLLMLILMAIPVVNVVVCILWIVGKNGNPNRRNFAKAWLILAVISTILTFGILQFVVVEYFIDMQNFVPNEVPTEQLMGDFIHGFSEV